MVTCLFLLRRCDCLRKWRLVEISEVPEVWEVLRCDRLSGALSHSYHANIQDREDGSLVEHHVNAVISAESSSLRKVT